MYKSLLRYHALINLHHQRMCPSIDILTGPLIPSIQAHIDVCPTCRTIVQNSINAKIWERNLPKLRSLQFINNSLKITPGQLWTISNQIIDGWCDDNNYYNAPTVLVINTYEYNVARVAQVCNYPSLASINDVYLTASIPCFVETWNVFSLPFDWLNGYCGTITENELNMTVLKHFTPLHEDHDDLLLHDFHQMEIVHSAHYAIAATSYVTQATCSLKQ